MSQSSPVSARAADLIDYIEQSTPPTYMDDVMFDRADRELILAALRSFRVAQTPRRPTDEELLAVLNAAIVALKSRDQSSFEMKVLEGLKVAMAQLEDSVADTSTICGSE